MHRPRHSHPIRLRLFTSVLLFSWFLLLVAAPGFAADRKQSNGSWETRSGGPVRASLSGTLQRQSQATTTWFLYPNACNDRGTGSWSPATSIVADSLNTYSIVSQNHGYPIEDQSLREMLWHVTDGSDSPDVGSGLVLNGTRSLWCGKYDTGWVVRSGYPNRAYSVLYVDTGAHGGSYNLTWTQNVSTELNYDYLYVIGGIGGVDPIGNSRAILDHIIDTGSDAAGALLVAMTGSVTTSQSLTYASPPGVSVVGSASAAPATVTASLAGVPAGHRAIYFVLVSDPGFSSEDGLWPFGHGAILDLLAASDNGTIYSDQAPVGVTDAYGGFVIVGTGANPVVSSRVPPGVGTLWRLNAGSNVPTSDACSPVKSTAADRMFEGGDASSHLTLANTIASIRTCTFPVPSGIASVLAVWGEYLDLPRSAGFAQRTDFRVHKGGSWSDWIPVQSGRSMKMWSPQAWTTDAAELTEAAQADSVQLRYTMECVNALAVDHVNCAPVLYGVLYDDLRLQVTTGVPAPIFRVFVGGVAQSTFVDGTDATSTNCTAGQISSGECWPGLRGSNVAAGSGPIHDNFNSPLGDSITLSIPSALRRNGMGVNWHYGFDRAAGGGRIIAVQNGAYSAALGAPRVIYRLLDPATTTWSPWDSSELDANAAAVAGSDTIVIDSEYRMNWPPRDKYYVNSGSPDIGPNADANLPGAPGWTLGGKTKYSQVKFLPRGARMQYYFKAVDINGGITYQFSTDHPALEAEDLPYLPGSSIRAPDIIEFDVLPRKYPAGAGGSLAAGRTDADVLNLDGAYAEWSNQFDPVTQALRAMGVRADRYRFLQGLGEGNNIGGHELIGQRLDRAGNHFPNLNEYAIVDSLAAAYRIVIQSSHLRTWTVFEEQDALLAENWWKTDTGTNSGDRCILGTGDDLFNLLLNASLSFPQFSQQVSLAQNVFGVASVVNAWSNPFSRQYPTIDDRFAGGGPGLAAPGTFTYPVDGGCPFVNRFDGLTKIGSVDAQNAVLYPDGVTEVAGIARMSEYDPTADNDRNKALAYGFSIQFIRKAGIPTTAANYVHSGVENRMAVLYKFLTSCRRNTASVTTPCWPCPSSPAEMTSNWAAATGFQTGTYGDLYPIQDHTTATGVTDPGPGVPAFVNALRQNRPNPFNPETIIPYSISVDGRVEIRIFDVAGRLVRTLVDGRQKAGPNVARWDGRAERGRPLASGIYFYKIFYPDGTTSARKMTILR